MSNRNKAMCSIRPIDPDRDIPATVAVINAVKPEPISVDELATTWQRVVPGQTVCRVVAVDADDRVQGYGYVFHNPPTPDGQFRLWIAVAPDQQGQGIGSAIYNELLAFLVQHQARVVITDVRENVPRDLAFAQQRGYQLIEHHFISTLDLAQVDLTAVDAAVAAARERGITFQTFADVGLSEATLRRAYDLLQTCVADIPNNSRTYSYEEFLQHVTAPRWADPEGNILAVHGDRWVGMVNVRLYTERNAAYNMMTGVLRPYRRQGIARTLKLLALQYARSRQCAYIWTVNHAHNASIVQLNQQLGYRREHGRYVLQRTFGSEEPTRTR